MPAEICFDVNGRRICIPIYIEVDRRFPGDPDPHRLAGINLSDLVNPVDRRVVDQTVGWMETIGLDRGHQQRLAAMVQIADAAEALPRDIGSRLNAMMAEQMGGMTLMDGVSLHLDRATEARGSAA